MAYTQIDGNKDITFGPGMAGSDSSYFNFKDLEKLKEKYPDAEGFRVYDGVVDDEECAILVIITGRTIDGADTIHNETDDWVAFGCPRVIDTEGGILYEDLP